MLQKILFLITKMEIIMNKKLYLLLIILSFFYATSALAEHHSDKLAKFPRTEVWHVVWMPSKTTPLTALWTQRGIGGDYYRVWSNDQRATLYIDDGNRGFRFSGEILMDNGDRCVMQGMIREMSSKENAFDGSYSCARGDTGKLTGTITFS